MRWLALFMAAGLTACSSTPDTMPASNVIPDSLVAPVEAAPVPPLPAMDTQVSLPEACFRRDAEIALHVGNMGRRNLESIHALDRCNAQLRALDEIHQRLRVLEPD